MLSTGTVVRYYLGALALLGGALLELSQHPQLSLSHIRYLPKALLGAYRPVLWIVLFMVCMAISSVLSPMPTLSWTGLPYDGRDGVFAQWAFMLIAILAFIRAQQDAGLGRRVLIALSMAGTLLACIAIAESFLGRGLIQQVYRNFDLPLLMYEGTGQLGGMFGLFAAISTLLYLQQRKTIWLLPMALQIYVMGLSINRASVLGFGVMLLLMLIVDLIRKQKQWKPLLLASLMLATLVPLGWWAKEKLLNISRGSALNVHTVTTREMFWHIAWQGFQARPLTGWGAGQFQLHWFKQVPLTYSADFLRAEVYTDPAEPVGVLLHGPDVSKDPFNTYFIFKKKNEEGIRSFRWIDWKAHNAFLDLLVLWGLPGLALYLVGLLSILPRLGRNPIGWVLIGHHIYLFTWFTTSASIGALWLLWGLALYLPSTATTNNPTNPTSPKEITA